MRKVFIVVASLAAVVTVPATIAGASGSRQVNPALRGYLRARAAGIKINSAAKKIMEQAPVGSCLNDPIQSKCGKRPKAIVGTLGSSYGPSRGAPKSFSALQIDQCHVKAYYVGEAAGFAQGHGANNCTSAVSWQELIVNLREYTQDNSAWTLMNECTSQGPGGGTIQCGTSKQCKWQNQTRPWEDLAQGYADLNGTWYAAQSKLNDTIWCVA